MAGDGPDRAPAEHLAHELKIDRHVTFLGKQNHVERLIPLAHVLLMPSELESFGLAALEGMACGVVPVATRTGGVPELITDGEDGFLGEVGDVEGQAQHALQLLTDDDLHYRMAKAGRWNAAERFCTDKIIPKYEKFYREVIERA
jgi:glycosyltransferase involved in cell wall biosynthesis